MLWSLIVNAEPAEQRILSATTVYSNPGDYWQRFEVKSIDDIKEATGCIVVATVIRIQVENGWYYHACSKCSKKVERLYELVDENSSDEGIARFECGECGVITDVYPKIKLQVRVQDATGSSSFVLFERDVTGYVNKTASQLISNANNGDHFELFPAEFNTMVGKRFAWKIKVSTYNIVNKYYVYTVNKFTDEDSVIQVVLNRAATGEDSQNDVDVIPSQPLPALTAGPSAKDVVSGTGENASPGEALKSTTSSPGLKQKQAVQHDDEELVLTASSSKGRPDVQKIKIPKLEKF
uniref:uncharacterized protein LOC122610248 n=1 Tax=Erigeron canadensis TaxID=72917 RepID=UPI001CB8D5BC|nr:uncharacterized protein LOC122610248 [Erigeron canadensis]